MLRGALVCRVVAALAVAALAAGACSPSVPTASPAAASPAGSSSAAPSAKSSAAGSSSPAASADVGAVTSQIEKQVVAIRGLPQKAAVDPKIVDSATMKAYVQADFTKSNPADRVAADERLEKTLGLIPQDASLSGLEQDLLTSQVVGLYSPDDKVLYVLQASGGLGPSERMIFAHEFTHALQDQSFDLVKYASVSDAPGQGDRSLARLSLVEGDATTVMTVWAQSNLTMEELLKAAQDAADPVSAAIMARMPPYLRETTLFPYTSGEAFIAGLVTSGGWKAVDAAFASPPETTEQLLHAAKWASREPAIPVAIPDGLAGRMGAGWSIGEQDTLGEFQLQVWLRGAGGSPTSVAATAAAGWGGDRVALLDGPNGARAVVLLSAWDSAQDAVEFSDQAKVAIASLHLSAEVVYQSGATTVSVLVGSDDTVTNRLHQLLGASGV